MSVKNLEEIYSAYFDEVYRYVLKLCHDEQLAEEITQDTFFKVLKKIDTYRGECKLSVWICQIAKNTLYTYLSKRNRQTDYPLEIVPAKENFEQSLADKDMAMKIHNILHVMKEPYREVFWMKTFGELSFKEIGTVHGKSENWARVTYHRAKMKIKEELK